MFTPTIFKFKNEQDKLDFIKKYSFATMVNVKNGVPLATQLPFVISEKEGKLILSSHFAKANEQTEYLESAVSLVIFSEPHAYISPRHYDKYESVPTWDYIAVHAYGKARILHDENEKLAALEAMIQFYDKGYRQQWDSLTDRFKHGMARGIVAFEMEVSELQGQQKLSQNKTEQERQRIVAELEQSPIGTERDLAPYINKIKK